jgi:uncharacterized protein YndB with AHSA1/START domain
MKRVSINIEFLFKASPTILYKFLTTPSCLIRWFCDEVEIEKDIFTFIWEGAEEEGELIDDLEDERVRFAMEEYEEDEYLEFKMSKSPVTNETILEITDFCDEDEVEDQKQLWESQIERLRREVGG